MVMTWEYVAGFFDGEGNIRLDMGSGKANAKLTLTQADERGRILLTVLQEFMAEQSIRARINKSAELGPTGKYMYRLYIYNRAGVLAFLKNVFPFIYIKKLECQDIWRYLMLFPSLQKFQANCNDYGPARTVCSNGHPITPDSVYPLHNNRKPTTTYRVCRECASDSRKKRYNEVIKPIMDSTGLGMRQVTAKVITMYKEGKL